MTIAMLTPTPPLKGGMVNYALQLCDELMRRGHRVEVVGFRRQYPGFLLPRSQQIDPNPIALRVPTTACFDPLSPASWFETARQIGAIRPRALIIQYWMPYFAPGFGAAARLVRRRSNVPVILVVHNVRPHERQPGQRALARWLFGACDGFILHCHDSQSALLAMRPAARHFVVPHPAHHIFPGSSNPTDSRGSIGLRPSDRVILFFGHVRRYKGLELLLRATAAARESLTDLRLVIAGKFHVDPRRVERTIERLGLAPVTTLVDAFIPREEVGRYFAASDVVVLPYLRASQSGIIPIAYGFDRPVIATSVGGLPEQVVDRRTGYLVPPDDAAALAAALVRFFGDPEPRRFTEHIRRYLAQCTWERVAEAVERLAVPEEDI